jgi:site-specific DNA-methyltransferase (adenine-specific)
MNLDIYYKDDLCTLIQGDCIDIMGKLNESGLRFDIIITDPPYGINFQSNGAKQKRHDILLNDNNFDLQPYWDKILTLCKSTTAIYVYSRWDVAYIWQSIIKPNHQIIIPRGRVGMGNLNNFSTDYEVVLFKQFDEHNLDATPLKIKNNSHVKNPPLYKKRIGALWTDCISNQAWEHSKHPTQKTVESIEKMIQISSKEGDIILDPFCGSGTTLVASKKLNRRCYGIELDKKYCEITKNRLDNLS